MCWNSGSQSAVPGLAASASYRNLLERQILGPNLISDSEILRPPACVLQGLLMIMKHTEV